MAPSRPLQSGARAAHRRQFNALHKGRQRQWPTGGIAGVMQGLRSMHELFIGSRTLWDAPEGARAECRVFGRPLCFVMELLSVCSHLRSVFLLWKTRQALRAQRVWGCPRLRSAIQGFPIEHTAFLII